MNGSVYFLISFLCIVVPKNWSVANTEDLFGITATELVKIDVDNPSQITVIGATNIPSNFNLIYALTYHRDLNALFGIAAEDFGHLSFGEIALFEYDIATGQASKRAILGEYDISGEFGSLSFVECVERNKLVVSIANSGNDFISSSFVEIATDGVIQEVFADNGRDNDSSFYDRTRDLFYVLDANDSGQLTLVDFRKGINVDLGSAKDIQYGTYSEDLDTIFALRNAGTELVQIATTDGLAPICVKELGQFKSAPILGLAFVPQAILIGDVNCDGEINLLDVAPFIEVLSSGNFDAKADVNQDCVVNLLDVEPFIILLSNP